MPSPDIKTDTVIIDALQQITAEDVVRFRTGQDIDGKDTYAPGYVMLGVDQNAEYHFDNVIGRRFIVPKSRVDAIIPAPAPTVDAKPSKDNASK